MRFESLNVRIHSRRTFLRRGSAAVTGLMLGACKSDNPSTAVPSKEVNPISTNEEFYAVWYRGAPVDIELDEWRLSIQRQGISVGELDWATISSMTPESIELTLQCIESRPGLERMNNAIWSGLPLDVVLAEAGIEVDGGSYIRIGCADEYSLALPISDMERPIWLLWSMNGEMLPSQHGYPLRAIIPDRMGWMNPKQVTEIDFIDEPFTPHWVDEVTAWLEEQGITMDTGERSMSYQLQALIVDSHDIVLVDEGQRVQILGKAFAGSDPVVNVEVSTDGGECWECAELTYAPGPDRWTLWRFDWTPDCAGTFDIEVRCQTASGMKTDPDAPLNHIPWAGGMSIEIQVS